MGNRGLIMHFWRAKAIPWLQILSLVVKLASVLLFASGTWPVEFGHLPTVLAPWAPVG